MNQKTLIYASIAAAALGVFWVYNRGIGNAAADMASGAVDAVNGVFVGSVQGVADVFGIPPTEQTKCQADIAAGRTWDASFSCPATDFLSYLVS